MPRVGVLGSLVWDEIHGRVPGGGTVEEWGGIAYALAGMDAALPEDWEIIPLIKVGRDLAPRATELLGEFERLAPGARCVEVPVANNRVTLRYQSSERRCERMSGGVPGWTWPELGPMVADLDALYVNFISGFEMCLGTAEAVRRGFDRPIYADLHSLFLGTNPDGIRTLRPLPSAASWFSFYDVVQLNEDEMLQLGGDPLSVASDAIGSGVSLLNVTVGSKGVVYVACPGFTGLVDGCVPLTSSLVTAIPLLRTERLAPPDVSAIDPTGCGDVFGATCWARMLAGNSIEDALTSANRAAARNATFHGATGLARHLRGELVAA